MNGPNTKQVVLYSQHNSASSMQKKPSSQSSSIPQVILDATFGDADGVSSDFSVSESMMPLGAGAGVPKSTDAVGALGAFGAFGALGALGLLGDLGANNFLFIPCEYDGTLLSPPR